jgi:hypothetical protein
VLEWLLNNQSKAAKFKEGDLFALSVEEEVTTPLEKPEIYNQYLQYKNTGLHLMEGGLYNQPHIWILEINAIENAINQAQTVRINNVKAAKSTPKSGANIQAILEFIKPR